MHEYRQKRIGLHFGRFSQKNSSGHPGQKLSWSVNFFVFNIYGPMAHLGQNTFFKRFFWFVKVLWNNYLCGGTASDLWKGSTKKLVGDQHSGFRMSMSEKFSEVFSMCSSHAKLFGQGKKIYIPTLTSPPPMFWIQIFFVSLASRVESDVTMDLSFETKCAPPKKTEKLNLLFWTYIHTYICFFTCVQNFRS
jgi:hypothetical protein